jgi:tetratricopeptide (TPR) repeat protein
MLVFHDLGMIYSSMANNLNKNDRNSEAIHFYEKSNELLEKLDFSDPGSYETGKVFLENHISLAGIFSRENASEKAIDYYIKAENILAGIILKIYPENTDMLFTQATIYSSAGELYMEIKDFDNAIHILSNAIRLYDALLKKMANNVELLQNLSMDYYRVGAIYAEIGKTQQAYTGFLNAAFFGQELHKSDPENVDHWITLSTLYWNIFGFCPPDETEMWLNRSNETMQAILQSGSAEENVLELHHRIINALKKREG